MEISLDQPDNKYHIRSYQNGFIRINDSEYNTPILVGLDTLRTESLPYSLSEIDIEILSALDLTQYEVVLLGTGKELKFPAWDLLEHAQMMGTPLEVMATDAACRTFTILASEGRKVLAILYP